MIKMAHQISGYVGESVVSERELQALFDSIKPKSRFCEVGTYHGATCRYLATGRTDSRFLCVDNFWRSTSPGMVDKWMANARPNMNLFVGTFQEFAVFAPHPQFDSIFVDALHTEEGCLGDLETARTLLLPDGILTAHDYERVVDPGVKVAVDRYCSKYQKSIVHRVGSLVFIG